jgi:thymidylate synthase ThyX
MQVYALTGVPPEIQAYAMAKYSRSSQSMRESIGELSAQRAEQFLDTFYFQYGHRSIADLAHIALAVEEISILAAIRLVDEPLWDGQERSTRYQDFRKSGYHVPEEIAGTEAETVYRETADALFAAYHRLSRRLTELLARSYPCPEGEGETAHRRTLRARAFDVARYLLPTATYTGLGYLLSARTLERQIGRLLSDPLVELREIGAALKDAVATRPAFNPQARRLSGLVAALEAEAVWERKDELAAALRDVALAEVPAAPTLVKYTAPSAYLEGAYAALAEAAAALLPAMEPDGARGVELIPPHDAERELVATLLYRVTSYSYRQVLAAVEDLSAAQRGEVIALAYRGRGPHDPPLREMRVGSGLIFDVCMDCGGFRDLHRHRNCVQVVQPFSGAHGYDVPEALAEAGLAAGYTAVMDAAGTTARLLATRVPGLAQYALPLGYRRRTLFKMDAAELAYVAEVRTRPAGHFSYREIAHEMYLAFARAYPGLAAYVRVTDPHEERFFER